MTTSNPNTNQPGLLDRATSFFKGTSKKPTNTLTSSLEHLHTNQHAQADAEAQHQADLMSGFPSDMPSGTQSLSSETIPQPMPRQVLNDVLGAHGHVPHAHHVDVEKVEERHEQAVGPLGHVQQTSLLDKAKQAIDSLTGKTSTQHPIQHHPNIPHSVLPDATLKQVQIAQGHPPHAHHVDVDKVEQRHEQAVGTLGHVQPEPNILEKMSQKLQELVPPTTFTSTSTTTTVHTHPNIPHAAVPDQVLLDVQSQHGKVPHATHVNVDQVEQRHEQAVGPLGTVQKEPGLLERMSNKISELVPSLTPTTSASTSNIIIHTNPNIPHSALSNNVLRDIQLQHGRVPRAHHVDIKQVERKYEQNLGLGHVQDITLLHKAKHAIDSMTGKTVTPLQHRPIQRHHNIPHSILPDATLLQIQAAHGHPPHAKHVDIGLVEQRQEQRMREAIGPLGHVQPGPTLLEKASLKLEKAGQKIQELTQPLATSLATATTTSTRPSTLDQHPNIPHAAVPDQVLQDVQSQKGKVPHAHHVDINKVEKQHEQAVGPLGHVQPEPTLLDKMGNKLQDLMNRPITTTEKMGNKLQDLMNRPNTTTTSTTLDAHPNIPHAAVPDQVLKDVQSQKGKVPHAHHVDVGQVEQRHEQAVGPLGHVQEEPTLMDKTKNALGIAPTITKDQAVPNKDLHLKNAPDAKFINVPQTSNTTLPATSSSLAGTTLPATSSSLSAGTSLPAKSSSLSGTTLPTTSSLPGETTLPSNDQGVMPPTRTTQAPVVSVEPTLLDKMEYKLSGVVPTKAAPTTATTQTAADSKKPTTTTTTDHHPNIPHAAVPDQVLKDVQHQKGKVPHAHHVDVGKVEQRHEQAVGPLGHVQKEPTLMDKAKHAIGLGDTTTSKPSTSKSTVPVDEHSNIPHAAVPDQVLKDVQHQKGKVPHAHHVDVGKVEQRHEQAVGPLGHVQKEPTLMDKAKHALGMEKDHTTTTNKDHVPSTTINKDEPVTKDLHLKKVPDAKFINVPQTSNTTLPATSSSLSGTTLPATSSSLSGSTLPATASAGLPATAATLPGTTTLPPNDQGVMPIQSAGTTTQPTVVPVEPTLLDKMEYKLFGVVPTKAAPTTTTTTQTAADSKKPTTTTTTDQHSNIPHAAVPDQVLKDVQHQKGKVPHAHHVDVGKVEQQHEQAVGPLGHVQKEPTLMDKAKHALGMGKDKTTTTTTTKEQPTETRPNIMHNSLPSYVMSDIKDAHGQVPHAHHVDMNQAEKERDRNLSNSQAIGRVQDDSTRPNIMHNSLPTRVMNELKDQHGQVPHSNHVDLNQVEGQRERRLSQDGLIGRVVDPSKRPNVMHSSLPTNTLNEIESHEGHVPNAHHVDVHNMERERERNLAQNKDIGRVMEPSSTTGPNIMHNSLPTRVMQGVKDAHGQVPQAHHVDINQVEKDRERRLSDSHMMGRVSGSKTTSPERVESSGLKQPERSNSGYTVGGFPESNANITSSAPAPTAYFKNTTTAGLPSSSLTSDIGGNKSGILSDNKSTTSKSTTPPLVATLPSGSNLESASGVKFQPDHTTSSTNTTSNIKLPTFHPQQQ